MKRRPRSQAAVVGRTEYQTSRGSTTQSVITPEGVSANRSLDPAGLRRRLQGDLDTIVMKALRKQPQDRYVSVAEFSNDIERHLSGKPVTARKRTIADHSGRFLRKHTRIPGHCTGSSSGDGWPDRLGDTGNVEADGPARPGCQLNPLRVRR